MSSSLSSFSSSFSAAGASAAASAAAATGAAAAKLCGGKNRLISNPSEKKRACRVYVNSRRRVGEELLRLLSTLEGVLGSERDRQEVLVRVDEGVGDTRDRGVVERQRDGGDGLDSGEEAVDEVFLGDVEDAGREHLWKWGVRLCESKTEVEKRTYGPAVEDLDDAHTVAV
jgi:hypothetical protein